MEQSQTRPRPSPHTQKHLQTENATKGEPMQKSLPTASTRDSMQNHKSHSNRRDRSQISNHDEKDNASKNDNPQNIVLTPHTQRLLRLIQQGTQSHASYAAAILGQITSRSSCLVLWDILGRVQHFLLHPSSSWETRQNAALAIMSVAKNIPISDQMCFVSETTPYSGKTPQSATDGSTNGDVGLWLSVNDFVSSKLNEEEQHPLDMILKRGRLLLSTTGTEYDVDPEEYEKESKLLRSLDASSLSHYNSVSNTTETEQQTKKTFLEKRIRLQRNILIKRLGLGVLFRGENNKSIEEELQEFITDDDLIVKKNDRTKSEDDNLEYKVDGSKSLRQQNIDRLRKKRKLATGKHSSKENENSQENTLRTILVLEMKKTNIQDEKQEKGFSSLQASSHGNPQALLATEFIYHMFDPDWKVRHGAFLGTLSLLRAWNFNAMQFTTENENIKHGNHDFSFGRWPDDILSRCLCVLALDRFCDYAGGTIFTNKEVSSRRDDSEDFNMTEMISAGMVAPVRESAAQLLSIVLSAAPKTIFDKCWSILMRMIQCKENWEVRHGAFLAMKYISALILPQRLKGGHGDELNPKKDISDIENIRRDMVNIVANGLLDSSDDVKTVAAQVLRCILKSCDDDEQNEDEAKIIEACSHSLWKAILMVHNVSACAIDLLILFSDVIRLDCKMALRCITIHSIVSHDSVSLPSTNTSTKIIEHIVQKLVQFLDFDSMTVQLSSLYTLSSVCKPIASNITLNENEFGRMLALFCALLAKLFESFFDPLVIDEAQTGESNHDTSHKEKMKRLVDARLSTWDSTVHCLFCLLSNIHHFSEYNECQRNQLQRKYFGSIHQLIINLLLRYICIDRKNERMDNDPKRCGVENPTDINIKLRRIKMNENEYFPCQLLASKSIAKLCSKLSQFLQKDKNSIGVFHDQYLCFAIRSLLHSPWARMTEGGCFLFLNLCIQNVPVNLKSSQETLVKMNAEVPLSIMANADENFEIIKNDLRITSICDAALLRFLNKTSLLSTENNTHDCLLKELTEGWKKIFISIGVSAPFCEGANLRQYPLTTRSMRVAASVAGAVVSAGRHGLPSKLTPLIRSLMTSIKNETLKSRQEQTCQHLVRLICVLTQASKHQGKNNLFSMKIRDRIIDNICNIACSECNVLETVAENNDSAHTSAAIQVIQMLMIHFQELEIEQITPFWIRLSPLVHANPASLDNLQLTQALQVLCILSKSLQGASRILNHAIQNFLPILSIIACSSPSSLSRQQAVTAATNFCKGNANSGIPILLPHLMSSLRDLTNESRRFGGCNLLQSIIDSVGLDICPFVRYLLPIAMTMMTDIVEECAKLAANIFASLVRVAPLVSNTSKINSQENDLEGELSNKVIDHLIHGKPIPFCPLPERLSAAMESSNISLRNYQKDGISWIRFLQSVNLNGALCDDMGLGKTLQALIGIGMAHCENQNISPPDEESRSLVVCPSTLVGHWEQEIERFFPDGQFYKVLRHDGSIKKRRALWKEKSKHANIIVTSYSVLRLDIDLLSKNVWTYCVLDEGHLLKNPRTATAKATRRIRSKHKLILTGTPVQNRVNELWAIFDFLMPNFLGNEKCFVKKFAKPIANGQIPSANADAIGIGVEKLKILHQQVLPFILRREKNQVLKELPPKNITNIPCSMSKEQSQLYKHFSTGKNVKAEIESVCNQLSGSSNGTLGKETLKKLLYLRLICTHPLLALSKSPSEDVKLHDKYYQLDCSGKLLVLNDLMRHAGIYSDELAAADNDQSAVYIKDILEEENSSKDYLEEDVDLLLNQSTDNPTAGLKSKGGSKCLIFAQYTRSLDILEEFLFESHMPSLRYLRLDGNVPPEERMLLATRFNQDDGIKVMLLTTKVGSLGLNLTSADTVIFLELDWNPQVDLQAMDRVHRIGQQNVVNVYRLVSSGTIEEQILKLQQVKMKMAEAVVNSENSTMYSMGTDRLLDIFTTSGDMGTDQVKPNPGGFNLDSVEEMCAEDEYVGLSVKGFLSVLGRQ